MSKDGQVCHIEFTVAGCQEVERFGDIYRLENPSLVPKLTMRVDKWMHIRASHNTAYPYKQIKPKIYVYTLLFYQTGSDAIKL
jgi:hypothetical protein